MRNILFNDFRISSPTKLKLNKFFDFFLPRQCSSCKRVLPASIEFICEKCFSDLVFTDSKYLLSEYLRKFFSNGIIADFKASFLFEEQKPVQNIIHALKYGKNFLAGIFLGKIIAKIFYDEIKNWNADFIVPIPIHRLKKAERGYNQSDFIAKGISIETGIDVKSSIVERIKYTQTQTYLNFADRITNVRNAFKVRNSRLIERKKIIIIDDVLTSGATVTECARTIKNSGAEKIYALFAAIP